VTICILIREGEIDGAPVTSISLVRDCSDGLPPSIWGRDSGITTTWKWPNAHHGSMRPHYHQAYGRFLSVRCQDKKQHLRSLPVTQFLSCECLSDPLETFS
jgi:hypothetical protein